MSPASIADVDADQAITAEGFDRILRRVLEDKIRVYPARAWYPSSIGHPCDRFSVWRFTRSSEQGRHSAVLQSIFDQGNDCQPLIYAKLDAMNFKVIREYDRPIQYEPRKGVVISGRPDGKILGWQGTRYTPPYVLEAKSMSGYAFDSIHTVDDLRTHPSHYTRNYYTQGNLYAYLEDLPHGVFVLYSKATGMLKLMPFDLDYDHVEQALRRVERLQPMVRERKDPPPIPYDKGLCGGCAFGGLCYPARSFGEGVEVMENPELVAKLDRRASLAPSAKDYDWLDKEIKDSLKHQGIRFVIVGPWVIEGRQASNGAITYSFERLGEPPADPA